MNSLSIIIPFYKNAHLAKRIGEHFINLAEELIRNKARLILINDSPNHWELECELKDAAAALTAAGVEVELLNNEENLGFVLTTNRGLIRCLDTDSDALLLNSDALPAPGAITEMRRVLALDPMFGFACPRSNNASICSLPINTRAQARTYEEALANFQELSPLLPEWQIIPTAVGFCMLIRHVIIREFGLLDPAYSPGYNEENDFCFRANRCGYSAVLANRAFAFHDSSSSFGEDERSLNDEKNRPTLLTRYPEYDRTVGEYLTSPAFRFEQLLRPARESGGVRSVAIDLSHFRTAHNGTYEFGRMLIKALYGSENRDFELNIVCNESESEFHDLEREFPALRMHRTDTDKIFDIAVKPAQSFEFSDLSLLSRLAPYNFMIMLDTIAFDCAYIRPHHLRYLWDLTSKTQDGLMFISRFSQDQFVRRFPEAAKIPLHACQLSVHWEDYVTPGEKAVHTGILPDEPYVLVIGNHYQHKHIKVTLEKLSESFPEELFVALGGSDSKDGNVLYIKSGALSKQELDSLYWHAKAVVFPSHYEGFGFPIPHSLARGKHVIARRTSLNEEIYARWTGPGTLTLFDDFRSMRQGLQMNLGRLEEPMPDWQKPAYNWKACGQRMIEFIKEVVAADPEFKKCRYRIQELAACEVIADFKNQVAEKEKQRVEVSDMLHERNLAYLALIDEQESRQETSEPYSENVQSFNSRIHQ